MGAMKSDWSVLQLSQQAVLEVDASLRGTRPVPTSSQRGLLLMVYGHNECNRIAKSSQILNPVATPELRFTKKSL